jgi:hypothetical protein
VNLKYFKLKKKKSFGLVKQGASNMPSTRNYLPKPRLSDEVNTGNRPEIGDV